MNVIRTEIRTDTAALPCNLESSTAALRAVLKDLKRVPQMQTLVPFRTTLEYQAPCAQPIFHWTEDDEVTEKISAQELESQLNEAETKIGHYESLTSCKGDSEEDSSDSLPMFLLSLGLGLLTTMVTPAKEVEAPAKLKEAQEPLQIGEAEEEETEDVRKPSQGVF
jgi:hypothetical protein